MRTTWTVLLAAASGLLQAEISASTGAIAVAEEATVDLGGARRLIPAQKVQWARTALGLRADADDEIADATRDIRTADQFIQSFGRIRSALGRRSATAATAGPFTGQVLQLPKESAVVGRLIGAGQWGEAYLSADGRRVVKIDKRSEDLWSAMLALNSRRTLDQLPHEAEMQARAERAGVRVPHVYGAAVARTPGATHDALLMDFAPGRSLQDRPLGALAPAAQQRAAAELVSNLVRMIAAGVANDDQAAQNIMVTDAGVVTFIDLGAARTEAEATNFESNVQKMVRLACSGVDRGLLTSAYKANTELHTVSVRMQDVFRTALLS